MYEVLILSEPNGITEICTSDVIDMVGVPNWEHVTCRFLVGTCCIVSPSIYCPSSALVEHCQKPPKNIEDSIKNGLIITVTTKGIFFALKAANEKPPKMSFDAMDIMKLAGGICGGVYQKWIKE